MVADLFGLQEIEDTEFDISKQQQYLCAYNEYFCTVSNSLIVGDLSKDEPEAIKEIFKGYPAGTSIRTLQHWSQVAFREGLTRYRKPDNPALSKYFGILNNNQSLAHALLDGEVTAEITRRLTSEVRYSEPEPPLYEINKIGDGIPWVLIGGDRDLLNTQVDMRWFRDQLVEAGALSYYEEYQGSHMSFLCAKNATFYDKVMEMIEEVHQEPAKIDKRLKNPEIHERELLADRSAPGHIGQASNKFLLRLLKEQAADNTPIVMFLTALEALISDGDDMPKDALTFKELGDMMAKNALDQIKNAHAEVDRNIRDLHLKTKKQLDSIGDMLMSQIGRGPAQQEVLFRLDDDDSIIEVPFVEI